MKKSKTIAKYVISGLLLVVSVYFAVQGIEVEKLMDVLGELNWFWVALSMPVVVLSHLVRAMRWKTLISPFHKAKSLLNLFSATIIGYLFNNVTPRGGEFIRPYIYSKREKISYSSTFATIIVERFIDLITLGFLIAVVFVWNSDKIIKAFPEDTDPIKLVYISIAILVVLFLGIYPPFVKFVLRKMVKPFSENIYTKLNDLFEKFTRGFAIIKSPSRYFRVIVESLSIWILYALPLYILFFAFGFDGTYNLGIEDSLLLVIVSGIGVTIAPVPGAIGVYHFLVKTAMMQLYGMDAETSFAYATVAHAVAKILEIAIGAGFVLRENIKTLPNEEELEQKAVT